MRAARLVAVFVMSTLPALPGVIDFEGLPDTYMFLGGGQNIGSFFVGVDFGPDVTGLDLTGSTAFPPHSGSIAVWDPSDPTVNIDFDTPQDTVGIWYTSFDLLTFAAYDDADELLSSLVAPANTDGTTGSSDFVSLTVPNIASVTLTGSAGNFVFDDVTFSETATTAAPEPASMVLLLFGATMLVVVTKQSKALPERNGSAINRD